MIHAAALAIGALLVMLSLPGTLELLLVTVGAILPPRAPNPGNRQARVRRLAVVIPAHDEASSIAAAVSSVAACVRPESLIRLAIVVVADNCRDHTATAAAAAGADVIERFDSDRRGKGYALQYAFARLTADGFDAFLVVDADTKVESNLLTEVVGLLNDGADAVQTRYLVLNPTAALRTRLMNTALMAANVVRPRGRQRLGLSAGILGNGFAVTSGTLAAAPYDASSIVEDLEYSLRLVTSGRRVQFADKTTVRALMPGAGPGVESQRLRWEGGRFRMLGRHAPALAREVLRGRVALIEPLLDLLLLPLAFHVVLLGAALIIPIALCRIYAVFALTLVFFHIIVAIVVGGGGWRDLAVLLVAPFYVLWKLRLLPKILRAASGDMPWTRTERVFDR
ncbi:MAG TPA: glycosyltransferase family 2 protein [Candidatus Binataceae bacterium]|nr:glycosyltransferase family 2 protein [Candidatus Binataceae bacterium]